MGNLVGLVGWRGMVGSVLIDRMLQEKDFDLIEPIFFSTLKVACLIAGSIGLGRRETVK